MTLKKTDNRGKSDKRFDKINFVLLSLVFIIVAYPLYFIIISSISDPKAVASGQVLFYPVGFSLDGYNEVFKNKDVIRGFANSIFYTFIGTVINLAVTIPTAFALSRDEFRGGKFVTIFYMITMFVSGGMIPTYLVVRDMKMLDSIWSLVIPGAVSVYNMIVARTFFKSNIPDELMEAAKLDGCSTSRFFFSIALPLSGAVIAILVLYYGIGHWNSYFSALLYITTPDKFPLQLVLRSILVKNTAQLSQANLPASQKLEMERLRQTMELMKYSLIIISSVPVMILYPFVQKHFVKGVMVGSVKG